MLALVLNDILLVVHTYVGIQPLSRILPTAGLDSEKLYTYQTTSPVCLYCLFFVDCWLSENLMYLLSLVNGLTGDLPFLMTYFT